jgi:hypothetical protein
MGRQVNPGWKAVMAMLAIGLISACGAAPAAHSLTPDANPLTKPALDANRIALQTIVPASALSSLEQTAAARGSATYTGYTCVIAPVGCACENPVIQDVTFNFTPDNRLLYDFTPRGSTPAEWQLDHAGFNQWSYTAPVSTQSGQVATLLALLSFTQVGYIVTQVATYRGGEISECKNIDFHLLNTPVPTPIP